MRYALKDGVLAPTEKPVTVLSGMPITGDHPMHPFAIDAEGNLFVSMGSATNTCEVKNRMPHSPGNDPCTELETRAGIWRYDANKTDQVFSPKERYASGIRNGEGFDFDAAGRIFARSTAAINCTRTGPKLYTVEQGFELPAEKIMILKKGAWYGWPKCYFDPEQRKLVLAPEYGGDGGKKVGDCAQGRAAGRGVPGTLGAERSQDLQGDAVPRRLSRRRIHRFPRLVEPRARSAGRLQRRVPAACRRKSVRRLCRVRRRLSRSAQGAGPRRASAVRLGRRP